jgi:adenylate cyclase
MVLRRQDICLTARSAAARRAVDLDANDAWAHAALGLIGFYMNQLDAAAAACSRALELNPNLAAAEGWLAVVLSWRGDYDAAVLHAEKATRLSPRDIHSMGTFARTCAEFGAGRYEQAVQWARRTIDVTPAFPAAWLYLTFSLALLDRLVEARAARDELLRVMPNCTLRLLRAALPSHRPEEIERRIAGLRRAGVPE